MESPTPASHLVDGLRQLITDIHRIPELSPRGLSDVVLAETRLLGFPESAVAYCGLPVEELCDEGSFESVVWLLLNQSAADPEQLADISAVLSESAVVEQPLADTIASMPLQTRSLDLFPLCLTLLSCFDPNPMDRTLNAARSQFWRIMAQVPVLLHVAFGGKLHEGRAFPDDSSRSLSYAGQLLQILRQDDRVPLPAEEQAMNTLLICQCLTEMRPACFAARFFGSTVTDIVAAVKAASSMYAAQLRNDPFAWTAERLESFKTPDAAEAWWNARSPRVMPFGFSSEPQELRTELLSNECRNLLGSLPALVLEAAGTRLEKLLAREQHLFPTMDWMSVRLLMLLNVPSDRIALAVGIARMAGWAAQCVEQHHTAIPLLPQLRYSAASADEVD
ncbi:MAG: hypothetical protein KDA81_14515 [Planctomycetaceae bacterium]|nr:hypothetical protein [Planctomycetaceae bacterium]